MSRKRSRDDRFHLCRHTCGSITEILNQYSTFVDGVTSQDSKDDEAWLARLQALRAEFAEAGMAGQVARLSTAAIGAAGEAGEVADLVKKVLFHGKKMTPEIREKLIAEAGDIAWYWANLCIALGVDPVDVVLANIKKLETRYPGGTFSVERSENRIV